MPIDRRDLLFLSKIPFLLSCEEHLSPSSWCFSLSFDWGIHKELPPSIAQKILTVALEEKILEKRNETLVLREKCDFPPLYKFDKKINPEELTNVKPYPLKSEIEYKEVELQIQKNITEKERRRAPLAERFQKPEKTSQTPKEEVKGEKKEKKEELGESKEESKEENANKRAKPKKQKSKDEKPRLTLDHFTKSTN
ncbi:MAG: hypothetical protein QXO71_01320 [Candidatus Jordarchaeaceae archaeon]